MSPLLLVSDQMSSSSNEREFLRAVKEDPKAFPAIQSYLGLHRQQDLDSMQKHRANLERSPFFGKDASDLTNGVAGWAVPYYARSSQSCLFINSWQYSQRGKPCNSQHCKSNNHFCVICLGKDHGAFEYVCHNNGPESFLCKTLVQLQSELNKLVLVLAKKHNIYIEPSDETTQFALLFTSGLKYREDPININEESKTTPGELDEIDLDSMDSHSAAYTCDHDTRRSRSGSTKKNLDPDKFRVKVSRYPKLNGSIDSVSLWAFCGRTTVEELVEELTVSYSGDDQFGKTRYLFLSESGPDCPLNDKELWKLCKLYPQSCPEICAQCYPKMLRPELSCFVPSFDVDEDWNPTGDLYTIRPIDLLRRIYDELGLVLRWYIAAYLFSPKVTCINPRTVQENNLFFSANEYTQNENTGQKQDQTLFVVVPTPASEQQMEYVLSKRASSVHHPPKAKERIRTLAGFFQLRCAWDCDKLLQHICNSGRYPPDFDPYIPRICRNKTLLKKDFKSKKREEQKTADVNVQYYGVYARNLFWIRNMLFHRTFLSEEKPQEYALRAIEVTFDLIDRLFETHSEEHANNPLPSETLNGPFQAHLKQLKRMKQILLVWQRQQAAAEPSFAAKQQQVQAFCDKMLKLLDLSLNEQIREPSKVVDTRTEVLIQLILTFGPRFQVPFVPTDESDSEAAETKPHEEKSEADFKTRECTHKSEQLKKMQKALRQQVIVRYKWDEKKEKPIQNDYDLSDPCGVNHSDMFWRCLDAMSTLLYDLLFLEISKNPDASCAINSANTKSLKLINVNLNGGKPFYVPVLFTTVTELPELDADSLLNSDEWRSLPAADAAAQSRKFHDPGQLFAVIRNILDSQCFSTHPDSKKLSEDILLQIKTILHVRILASHQYYVEKPQELTVKLVHDVVKGAMKLLISLMTLIDPGEKVSNTYKQKTPWKLLEALKNSLTGDRYTGPSSSGNSSSPPQDQTHGCLYRVFRFRQQGNKDLKQLMKDIRFPNAVRRILTHLRTTGKVEYVNVAYSLVKRFELDPPETSSRESTSTSSTSSTSMEFQSLKTGFDVLGQLPQDE